MRKLLFLILCLFVVLTASAQKYVPAIKAGSTFQYSAFSRAAGMKIPLNLVLTKLTDSVTLKWTIEGYGTGTILIVPAAVKSATKIALREPDPDGITKLKDDETLGFLSKDTFNSLVANKTFTLNGRVFNVVPDTTPFTINNKEADVFYAVTQNGKTKVWVLNNPDFPLICKLVGGPQGIDLTLDSLVE